MKKLAAYTALGLMMLTMAACGKKASTTETTTAAAAESSVPESEALDTNSLDCFVEKLEGNKLTVKVDDGTSMTFDISNAKINPAWNLMEGDEVEVEYQGSDPTDGMAVDAVKMSVPFEFTSEDYNEDPSIYGVIKSIDANTIQFTEVLDGRQEAVSEAASGDANQEDAQEELGKTYTFHRAAYETDVASGDIKAGTYALINYLGELDKDPVCYRICTDDMMDDDASDVYGITGAIDKIEDGIIYLKASDGTEFKFDPSGNDDLLKQAEADTGKKVEITYSDSIRQRVITADSIIELQ